jgi:hypothetical protein
MKELKHPPWGDHNHGKRKQMQGARLERLWKKEQLVEGEEEADAYSIKRQHPMSR